MASISCTVSLKSFSPSLPVTSVREGASSPSSFALRSWIRASIWSALARRSYALSSASRSGFFSLRRSAIAESDCCCTLEATASRRWRSLCSSKRSRSRFFSLVSATFEAIGCTTLTALFTSSRARLTSTPISSATRLKSLDCW